MSITVSYNQGQILINDRWSVPTSTFYKLNIHGNSCELNNDDTMFTDEQQDLRALDCMKDGVNIANQVYGISYSERYPLQFNKLRILEDKFTNCFSNKIKEYAWTKISKDSELEPKFSQRVIFKECGFDAGHFIYEPQFCGNFANEIIDPGLRSEFRPNEDIVFPENGNEIILDEKFLSFFGFIQCSVRATRRGTKNYTYLIKIKDVEINANSTQLDGFRVDWFQGNKKKNSFIINTNPSRRIKNGLLMAKEMGDVLQVLFMFIWSVLNENANYAMVTKDKVVFLQCMLLNLNCFLTSTEDEDGTKMRSIKYFEPKGYTIENAKARFNNEKLAIIEHNLKFIAAIQHLHDNPDINVYIQGYNDPFNFNVAFYQEIHHDLTHLNEILVAINVEALTTTDAIDLKLNDIKANFLFNFFFRPVNNNINLRMMTLSKQYSKKKKFMAGIYTYACWIWYTFIF